LAIGLAPSAQAFTFQDSKGNTIPKFDLEEQARQYRAPAIDTTTPANKMETPFGTLQFGVQRNSPFASPWSSTGNADRRHYERMFAPPARQHEYD
jgi:hypothetical protein